MKLLKHKIPLYICLIFLFTSPITQIIGTYIGSGIAYLLTRNISIIGDITLPLMLVFVIISIFGFVLSKNKLSLIVSSLSTTLFICNTFIFLPLSFKIHPYLTYPGKYIIGSLVSFFILFLISEFKEKRRY
jgi:Na+/glutamate symporter